MGKRLGQHFLHDQSVLADIIAEARLGKGAPVLEIGPGQGVLTERLLGAGARVTAVELDSELARQLALRWAGQPLFRLVEADVMKTEFDPAVLFGEATPYSVVANLPYYLSSALLIKMSKSRRFFKKLVLMVQKEVALRMVAGPDSGKEYGSLSIAVQHAFEARLVRLVPKGAFRPPPKVESAVVALLPKPPVLTPEEESVFLEHIKHLFTARRKKLAGVLKRRYPDIPDANRDKAFEMVGERRGETFSPEEHLTLFRLLIGGTDV